jgi:hypothetical protein
MDAVIGAVPKGTLVQVRTRLASCRGSLPGTLAAMGGLSRVWFVV